LQAQRAGFKGFGMSAAEPMAKTAPARPDEKVLLVMAHPAFERSRANRALVRAALGAPGVSVRDLYELYPDFAIDVPSEQRVLTQHSAIVLQYPVYWYATPALMKEWLDLVWLHGFAYGRGGVALKGKRLLVACTTGGAPEAYGPEGMHGFPIEVFLKPMEQTAALCGMKWERPFVLHGAVTKSPEALAQAAERFRKRLDALVEKAARR
jgi:glutathione-regulated potassium-efflux system ancillary protein KefG